MVLVDVRYIGNWEFNTCLFENHTISLLQDYFVSPSSLKVEMLVSCDVRKAGHQSNTDIERQQAERSSWV